MSIKIKQLEWEDCTPTISSSVVSRAQALGYEFEIYTDRPEIYQANYANHYMSINSGHERTADFIGKTSLANAKVAAQKVLQEEVAEALEVEQPAIPKAAEIQWDEIGFLSLCGRYEIWKDECGKLIPHFIQCGKRLQFTYGRDTIAEAQAACQPHKQKSMEEEYL